MKKIRIVRLSFLLTIMLMVLVMATHIHVERYRAIMVEQLTTQGYYDHRVTPNTITQYDVEELLKTTVYIGSDRGGGSGNVVKATEKYVYILTCYHVYDGVINTKGGDKIVAFPRDVYEQTIKNEIELVAGDEEIDLALIRIPNMVYGYRVATVASRDVIFNEDVICIGHPLATINFITRGYLGTTYYKDVTIFNMPVTFGNSGSAVFNMQGEIVGVVKQVRGLGGFMGVLQYMAISVTRNQIQEFLEAQRYE